MTKQATLLFRDDKSGKTRVFDRPVEMISAYCADDVEQALNRIDQARENGLWAAGYIAYEAGFVFEPKLKPRIKTDNTQPLVQFGLFEQPADDSHPQAKALNLLLEEQNEQQELIFAPKAAWDYETYREAFSALHNALKRGDCYQGNLTMPIHARYEATALRLFASLIARQPVKYGALIDFGEAGNGAPILVSRSPELFFSVDEQGFIETHPMKGTAKRGQTEAEDAQLRTRLQSDDKTLAENRMIVDLLRNDISRLITLGSLEVPKLFHVETYPTLHQLVSHVRGKLAENTPFSRIIEALFPCGSITGAPKMWAMDILARLEPSPRGAYCGAIGYCDPAGPMRFSVGIRTLSLFNTGQCVFNVGGGIVFDSTPEKEYEECLLKARFAIGDQWISR